MSEDIRQNELVRSGEAVAGSSEAQCRLHCLPSGLLVVQRWRGRCGWLGSGLPLHPEHTV